MKEFELLVLDDGSDDDTAKLVQDIKDNRLKYFKFQHEGMTKTLNKGVEKATYDIIARMDADDVCVPWRFERQLKAFKILPHNTLLSSWYAIFEKDTIQFVVKSPVGSKEIKKGLLLHSYISHPGLMCHKQTLIENGNYHTNVEIDAFQDYETWLKIKDKVEFTLIPEVLVFQRYRQESLSNNIFYKQRMMYLIQEPYYTDLQLHFGISDKREEQLIRGWREYFFGNKSDARTYWNNLGMRILFHPRASLAWLISFLPDKIVIGFKESRFKFRLQYFASYFSIESRILRKELVELLREGT